MLRNLAQARKLHSQPLRDKLASVARCPWPTETVMDEGREFTLESADLLENECGAHRKIVISRNPQANSMIELCHQTLTNMVFARQTRDKHDLDPELGQHGVLAARQKAENSVVGTTSHATPPQLVFGCDGLLDTSRA